MSEIKSHAPTPMHQAAMAALKEAMRPYADDLGAEGMLALAAQLVGNLIALQDQRKWTSAQVMELVSKNIEEGNAVAIRNMLGETKGEA